MAKFQVRIERENQGLLGRSAHLNMRSITKETNRIIRDHFTANPLPEKAKGK